MSTYTGICIDGPMAGSMLTHDYTRYEVRIAPPSHISVVCAPYSPVHSERGGIYVWVRPVVEGRGAPYRESVGFWVITPDGNDSDITALDAVNMLATAYMTLAASAKGRL